MPAANVPLRVCGRRRQPPTTAPLRPRRGSLPNCPAASIPPSHCGNSVVGLAGASGPKVSNVVGFLQAPHCRGRCAQFPRPGRPQAAKSGRASVRASGRATFQKPFSLTIAPPDEETRYGRLAILPRGHSAAPIALGVLPERTNFPEFVDPPGQQPAPTPTAGLQ